MGFNSMFSGLSGEGENSDRIFYKNGTQMKFMSGKQPITFAILPAIDPANPDKATSYLPSILPDPDGKPGELSNWGKGVALYRGIGHGDWKERCDIVSLKSLDPNAEDPMEALFACIKSSPEWQYLTDDGKWGDPNRQRATLPFKRLFLFCNVLVQGEQDKKAQVGCFSKSLANKLIGQDGIVFAPNPSATDADIEANYFAAFASGDITAPQSAPLFTVEKGHDKGEMSAYEIRFALDSGRRVRREALTQDILATRYDLEKPESWLNILTPQQIVSLLIRELNGRSPSGFHEYALLREALGAKYEIPEPPAAPAATHMVPGAAVPPVAQHVPQASSAGQPPVQVGRTDAPEVPPAATVQMQVPVAPVPTAPVANEANSALRAAQAAGAAVPTAAPAPAAQPKVVGDAVPKFDKAAFLARMAAKGGNQ